MQKISSTEELNSTFFDNVKIDSKWNFDDIKESEMHRIHAYPAKFPSFITRKAIVDIEKEQKKAITTVGDVFCGCGTTAYEAALNGKNFWGCDINPIAVLIAKVKSNTYSDSMLSECFERIKQDYPKQKKEISNQEISAINPRIHYWFVQEQVKELQALKIAIEANVKKGKYRLFFHVAFSNILKRTSKWLQKSIKPTIDPNKPINDVWQSFEKQFLMMLKASKKNTNKKTSIIIRQSNVLNIRPTSSIDLLVSSPPYVTSYEYADLHQMSALWLGYTDEYQKLRKGTIGSIHNNSEYEKNKKQLLSSGLKIVEALYKVDKSRAKNTSKYFVDMQKAMHKCYSLLTEKGQALFVIGNTEYKGVRIDNANHLVESMFQSGFHEVFITKRKISNKLLTPYRTAEGKFATSDTASRRIYSEEFIVLGKKFT